MSAHMSPFRENFSLICDIVLAFEAEAGIGDECACGSAICDTRCVECFPTTLSCKKCFVRGHQNNPFHWAEVWDETHFKRVDFSDIGGIIHLGHRGSVCPSREQDVSPSKVTVVHVNGVHTAQMTFCTCSDAELHWKQLLRHRLFPATLKTPETAFTLPLLKLSHMFSLCAQSSMYSIAQAIRRLTDDAFVHKIPVSVLYSYFQMQS